MWNITILTGDSGSDKYVLIELIRDYRRYGSDSGVFLLLTLIVKARIQVNS